MIDFIKLQEAIMSDNLQAVASVLKKAENVNLKWGTGITVIHYYVTHTSKLHYNPDEIIKTLVENGVDINAQNKELSAPLHFAVMQKNPKVAEALIKHGALVDIKDDKGNTPLWRAVQNYRGEEPMLECIKVLIQFEANPDISNNFGHSPRSVVLSRHKSMTNTMKPKEWDLQPHLNW